MSNPQQPEIRRSGRGETDQEGRRQTREQESFTKRRGRSGPVPADNEPGHHPDHEQDKPEAPAGG
jgi:hypothetical protein